MGGAIVAADAAQNTGFVLIVIGSILSFGRNYLSRFYILFHGWLRKQAPNERLKPAVTLYLMMTGTLFTIFGVLELLGILKW